MKQAIISLLLGACFFLLVGAHPASATATCWNVLWYGQSLAHGDGGMPVMFPLALNPSSTFTFQTTPTNTAVVNFGSDSALASTYFSGIQPAFSSVTGSGGLQDPAVPSAVEITQLANGTTANPFLLLITDFAVGAHDYAQLAKGTNPYTNIMTGLAKASGTLFSGLCTLNAPAMILALGESDAANGTSRANYTTDMQTLESDLTTDIPTNTGQSAGAVPLIMSQETNWPAFAAGNQGAIALGQWDAVDNSTIYFFAPLYQFDATRLAAGYYGHLSARGYIREGEVAAHAWYTITQLHQTWQPPMPSGAPTISGNVVTQNFTAMNPPLVLDCASEVTSPNGAADGFGYTDASSPPSITGVSVACGGTCVQVTLSAPPTATSGRVLEYANTPGIEGGATLPGPTTGLRGCLRDSTVMTSFYDGTAIHLYATEFKSAGF